MRAASTAWMLDGSGARRPRPRRPRAARGTAGCPRPCPRSARPSAGRATPSRRSPTSSRASAPESASSTISDRSGCGATQPGRISASSGRARQRSRIGVPARERDDVLEQVEQRRLGPVDVVDDHARSGRSAAARSSSRRTAQERLLRLGGARRPGRSRRARAGSARSSPSSSSPTRLARIAAGQAADDLGERAVGDALAVGQAAADGDGGLVAERGRPARGPGATCRCPAGRRR